MTRRVVWMIATFLLAVILLYLSRFWVFRFWGNEGLFGIQALRPEGGLLARWLRGTPFAPFELLIWVCGLFLLLTWMERAYVRLKSRKKS